MVVWRNGSKIIGSSLIFTQKKHSLNAEGATFRYFDVTMTKSEKFPLLYTSFLYLTKELQHSQCYLETLEEKRGKNETEIHAILRKYSFPVSRMESEGTVFYNVLHIL